MKALVCDEPGRLSLVDRERPVRAEGEILVRIRHVGICGTDFHIFAGKHPFLDYPRVMGHELSGTVEDGGDSPLAAGTPVYVVPYLTCGTCANFYGLSDKLAVGSITDMMGITSRLAAAKRLITL